MDPNARANGRALSETNRVRAELDARLGTQPFRLGDTPRGTEPRGASGRSSREDREGVTKESATVARSKAVIWGCVAAVAGALSVLGVQFGIAVARKDFDPSVVALRTITEQTPGIVESIVILPSAGGIHGGTNGRASYWVADADAAVDTLEFLEFWYSGLSNEEAQLRICVYSMDGSLEGPIPTPGCLDQLGPPSTWTTQASSPPALSKP